MNELKDFSESSALDSRIVAVTILLFPASRRSHLIEQRRSDPPLQLSSKTETSFRV